MRAKLSDVSARTRASQLPAKRLPGERYPNIKGTCGRWSKSALTLRTKGAESQVCDWGSEGVSGLRIGWPVVPASRRCSPEAWSALGAIEAAANLSAAMKGVANDQPQESLDRGRCGRFFVERGRMGG